MKDPTDLTHFSRAEAAKGNALAFAKRMAEVLDSIDEAIKYGATCPFCCTIGSDGVARHWDTCEFRKLRDDGA